MTNLDDLVTKFLSWQLPDSVCSDPCVTVQNSPHRTGTNLLTADEAKQMFEYLLSEHGNCSCPLCEADASESDWIEHTTRGIPPEVSLLDVLDVVSTSGAVLRGRVAATVKWLYVRKYRLADASK